MSSPKTRAKPGGWAYGEILTSSQQTLVDQNAQNSLDLENGGTHELEAALTIAGLVGGENLIFSGLDVFFSAGTFTRTGDMVVTGDLTGVDNLTLSALLTAQDGTFTDDLSVGDDLDVGGNLAVVGDVTCDDLDADNINATTIVAGTVFFTNLAVSANASIAGNITAVDDLTASGTVTAADGHFTDDLLVDDDGGFGGDLSCGGNFSASGNITAVNGDVSAIDGSFTGDMDVDDDASIGGQLTVGDTIASVSHITAGGRVSGLYAFATSHVIASPAAGAYTSTNLLGAGNVYIGVLASGSNYTFKLPNLAIEGIEVHMYFVEYNNGGSTGTLEVQDFGGTPIFNDAARVALTDRSLMFKYLSGAWRRIKLEDLS